MKQALTTLAAAIALASVAMATTAEAQVVLVGPAGIHPSPTLPSVVCEVRREQITDERGWRVRDVVICFRDESAFGRMPVRVTAAR